MENNKEGKGETRMAFILFIIALTLNLKLPIYNRDVLAERSGIPEERYLRSYLTMVYTACTVVMVTGLFIQVYIINDIVWFFDPTIFMIMYIISVSLPTILIISNIKENERQNAKWVDPTSIKPMIIIILLLIIGLVYMGIKHPGSWKALNEKIANMQ